MTMVLRLPNGSAGGVTVASKGARLDFRLEMPLSIAAEFLDTKVCREAELLLINAAPFEAAELRAAWMAVECAL